MLSGYGPIFKLPDAASSAGTSSVAVTPIATSTSTAWKTPESQSASA